MLKADDDDDDDSTFPSLFCEVVVVEPPPRSSFSFSSTSFLLPPPPGTNAGAFAFMVLYLCVSLLRSDWNDLTVLPLMEKEKDKTSSIIFSSITTATAMVERVKKSER